MEKLLKQDRISFDVTSGVTIEEFNNIYNKLIKEAKDKYGDLTDIKIRANVYEYNDGENYAEEIDIYYKRYETDGEFENRKYWQEYCKSEQERKEVELMKQYIQSYKNEALEIINSLK